MSKHGQNERTNEDETYRHRHIDIDIHPKEKKERRLYIPYWWQQRYKKLQSILAREGSSVSKWFREQADPYIDLHEPGNPQQRLDTIAKDGKPYHALVCQKHKQPVPYLMEFIAASGLTLRYCEDCFLAAKERGLVRVLKRKLT